MQRFCFNPTLCVGRRRTFTFLNGGWVHDECTVILRSRSFQTTISVPGITVVEASLSRNFCCLNTLEEFCLYCLISLNHNVKGCISGAWRNVASWAKGNIKSKFKSCEFCWAALSPRQNCLAVQRLTKSVHDNTPWNLQYL